MNKNDFILLICKRFAEQKVVSEIDYGRIEELSFLLREILYYNEKNKV
jgi:hypothetical protein